MRADGRANLDDPFLGDLPAVCRQPPGQCLGHRAVIGVHYSWLDDTDDEFKKELIEQCAGCEDLVECILYAHKNDCTWILFDNEAKVDRNLPLYEFDTMKICANCSHINIEGTRDPETGYCYHYDCEIDLCDGCDCDYYYGY